MAVTALVVAHTICSLFVAPCSLLLAPCSLLVAALTSPPIEPRHVCTANVVLFSTDISARGLDYPDVTAVVQVGVPTNRAQYIHRLGRTGRAGKVGEG